MDKEETLSVASISMQATAIEGAFVGSNMAQGMEGEGVTAQLEHPDDAMSNSAPENVLCNNTLKSSNIFNTSDTEHIITLTDIMKPITTCNSSVNILSRNLEGMREDLTSIRQDMKTFKKRMSAAEERLSTVEDSLHTAVNSNKRLMQQLSIHDSIGTHGESSLKNTRIVGLPERVERNTPVEFIEKWLISTMGLEHFSSFFSSGKGTYSPY